MKTDRIAAMRAGYEQRSRDDLDAEADEIVRLIDERELLLTALANLMARQPLTDAELDARVKLARAALAKAEAP